MRTDHLNIRDCGSSFIYCTTSSTLNTLINRQFLLYHFHCLQVLWSVHTHLQYRGVKVKPKAKVTLIIQILITWNPIINQIYRRFLTLIFILFVHVVCSRALIGALRPVKTPADVIHRFNKGRISCTVKMQKIRQESVVPTCSSRNLLKKNICC